MKEMILALFAMLALAGFIALVPANEEGAGPEPIDYGKAACARCRMALGQPGFAGELRDREGHIRKYDDLGCLLIAMWALHSEVPGVWVEDHDVAALVPLLEATFVVDSSVTTPMGYGIVAFTTEGAASNFVAERGGRTTTLEALLKDTKRFARDAGEHVHPHATGE